MFQRLRVYWIIAFGLILLAIVALVWGNTWRMYAANRYYTKADFERAQESYEDLLVDLPRSPYVLNNLGLSYLKQERNEKAITNIKKATDGLEGLALGKFKKNKLQNEFQYNLGNALYNSGEKSQDQQDQASYEAALGCFKQAIVANPKDKDAKYNYELTLLRLRQPPPPEQQKNEAGNIVNMNDAQYFVPQIREEEPVDKDW